MSDIDDDEDHQLRDLAAATELVKEMAKLLKKYNARVGFVLYEGEWIDVGRVQGACDLLDVMCEMERMDKACGPQC